MGGGVVRRVFCVAVCVLVTTSCGYLPFAGGDIVSYRPDTAGLADSADCMAENVYTEITGSGPWDPSISEDAPEPGYPPPYFEPVSMVRCEISLTPDHVETLDTVTLTGDVDAVMDAFRVDSKRYSDFVSVSCPYEVFPPVGLWFVDEAGTAFRPIWPSAPCGLQDGPSAALRALDEASRTVYSTGYDVDYASSCGAVYDGFLTTAAQDIQQVEMEPGLLMPTDDVGYLQLCRYPVGAEYGVPLVLSQAESVALIAGVSEAPRAQPCSEVATRVASAQLRSGDLSGGATVSFELDGCRRASGFGAYREVPRELGALLTQ